MGESQRLARYRISSRASSSRMTRRRSWRTKAGSRGANTARLSRHRRAVAAVPGTRIRRCPRDKTDSPRAVARPDGARARRRCGGLTDHYRPDHAMPSRSTFSSVLHRARLPRCDLATATSLPAPRPRGIPLWIGIEHPIGIHESRVPDNKPTGYALDSPSHYI
jgi:hypothetical protein